MRSLAALFDDLDHDGDGALSLQEFRMLLSLLSERSRANDDNAYASSGVGGGGSSVGGGAGSETLGLNAAHRFFRHFDRDASGSLSFVEWLQLLSKDRSLGSVAVEEAADIGGKALRKSKRRVKVRRALKKAEAAAALTQHGSRGVAGRQGSPRACTSYVSSSSVTVSVKRPAAKPKGLLV
jgi:hypothetical protein